MHPLKSLFLIFMIGTPVVSTAQLLSALELQSHILAFREKYYTVYPHGDRAPYTPQDTVYLSFFDIHPEYRLQAEVEFLKDTTTFDMPLYSGNSRSFRRYAVFHFNWLGEKHSLTTYQDVTRMTPLTRNRLFLPFKDASSGEETYGGGRYMDFTTDQIDEGKIWLDFNKAYNPWCAYSDGYQCPIPPAENHLEFPVLAGEKGWGKQD
jgi:uncharacterized protein (DUF1684 family)